MSDDIKEPDDVVLSRADLQSATWAKLQKHMTAQLESLRMKNDGKLSEIDTARVRGRIACLKELLALANPSPVLVADEQPE